MSKQLKIALATVLIWIIFNIVIYCIFAFVKLDFNPAHYTEKLRGIMMALSMSCLLVSFSVSVIVND